MENKYLLSIVIPTKNRQYYAIKCIRHLLSIVDTRLQIVIQDNSDMPGLEKQIKEISSDTRIKYHYTSNVLSFVSNFEEAVNQANGKYICMIGDDDGVNMNIMKFVDWAENNNIDAIKPEIRVEYFWPNSGLPNSVDDGILKILNYTGKIRKILPYKEVLKYLESGCKNYLSYDLVKLYHGIVKKKSLDEAKTSAKHYFGGLTPDIYITIALSLLVKRAVSIDYPITIAGTCKASGGADAKTGRHTGELKDAPHFRGHKNYEWNKLVPSIYSVETIWADSALAAIVDTGHKDLVKRFNVKQLFKTCIKLYPQYNNVICAQYIELGNTIDLPMSKDKMQFIYIKYLVLNTIFRILKKVKRIVTFNSKIQVVNNIQDIEYASVILSDNVGSCKL